MEWLYTEEQLAIQELVRKFVDKEILPRAGELDKNHEFPWDIYGKLCDMGLQCLTKPEEFGGPQFDLVTQCMVGMEICRGDIGVFGAIAANGLATDTMMIAANDEQKKKSRASGVRHSGSGAAAVGDLRRTADDGKRGKLRRDQEAA